MANATSARRALRDRSAATSALAANNQAAWLACVDGASGALGIARHVCHTANVSSDDTAAWPPRLRSLGCTVAHVLPAPRAGQSIATSPVNTCPIVAPSNTTARPQPHASLPTASPCTAHTS
ncbi:hypothetical protein EA660_04815 [Pseudoxanthomonas winnipegensis]|uniref:Uncharacterized protein n=1 Tax=Pseudoxanthomonas winnipegensis TaxID=2480810 RepID=A0A4Q8LCF5_9GAMM|nr:hypothetical protein EA660_04815 [Pseudoxanthomonas winnipegensis]